MADEAPGGSPDQSDRPSPVAPSSVAPSSALPASVAPASAAPASPVFSPSGAEPGSWPAVPQPPADVVPPPPGALPPPVSNGRRAGWRRWLPLAGVIGLIAICSVVMLLILGFSNGPAGLAVGLVAAILPVPVLVGCFL